MSRWDEEVVGQGRVAREGREMVSTCLETEGIDLILLEARGPTGRDVDDREL